MLENLSGPGGVLAKESPDTKEFDGLVRSGLARLQDAENTANSLESRFDLAYGAAFGLCLAALRYRGFRPSKRFVVFQVLPNTLGLGPEVWRVLDKCHKMRNRTEYEGALDVDDTRLRSDRGVSPSRGQRAPASADPGKVDVSWPRPGANPGAAWRRPDERAEVRVEA